MAPAVPLPAYGNASLAEVVPSLLAALGDNGYGNVLAIPECRSACLLLVDGLGARLLSTHAGSAPFLTGLPPREVTTGFPATTATSIGMLGTGRSPGCHGLVGYLMGLPGTDAPFNVLRWTIGPTQVLDRLEPERFQPTDTAFQRTSVPVTIVGPRFFEGSGLTRAALRGAPIRPVLTPADLVASVIEALREPGLVYAYVAELDTTGHRYGPGTDAWQIQLSLIDRLVEALADRLPDGSVLAVTGDHGMVHVPAEFRVDAEKDPALADGVRYLGGECRARHIYTSDGAGPDVLAAWRELLGDRMWVMSRAEVIDGGWFGPTVPDWVAQRIGNVVAAAYVEQLAVVAPTAEPGESAMLGHHGSLTDAERLVPFLVLPAS